MANIDLNTLSTSKLSKPLAEATDQEIYGLLLDEVRERCAAMPLNEGKRKLYYISAEFLIGKLLSNNLIDLGLFDDVREQLADAGHDLGAIEELEVEPSLGNGGLGRLAACFLDSIATLGLPGDGVGLNYHYGLIHQRFVDNQQAALPDEWLAEQGWLVPESRSYTVEHDDPRVAIIDGDDVVHMAHIDIHFGYSINGIAALHTQILEQTELRPFYDIYPQKFSNKTNGITFRRWLMGANPELAQLVDDLIGANWRRTGDLTGLMRFVDDEDALARLAAVKKDAKAAMRKFMASEQGVQIPEDAVIDVQVKRIHEYKRRQMLALYIIWKYLDIKNGNKPTHPLTIVFGGKAAPAYVIAQDIIHLVLTLSKWIAADPDVAPYLQVVMIENYNVTAAEHVIPAADVSEQISLASKEASGTSNMKFMLNGAVTLCTLDGANVEIAELAGDENIYTFGASSQQVEKLYADGSYDAHALYLRPGTKLLVDFITNPAFMATGNAERLQRLHDDMANKDWFMALLDIDEYIQKKEQVLADYEDRASWMRKALVNIAHAGAFSSDRTIAQYNDEIWHLK